MRMACFVVNDMALYAFDGTWNSPAKAGASPLTNTNVHQFSQLYAEIHGEDASLLKAQYLPGV